MVESIKCRISNVDHDDYQRGLFTYSVGEAAKRFTREQVEAGEAERWMVIVIELLNARSSGNRT